MVTTIIMSFLTIFYSNHQPDGKVQPVQIARQQIQLCGGGITLESLYVMLADSTTNYIM